MTLACFCGVAPVGVKVEPPLLIVRVKQSIVGPFEHFCLVKVMQRLCLCHLDEQESAAWLCLNLEQLHH